MSVESCHIVESSYAIARTGTLRVIAATCELRASFNRSLPLIDASTPLTDRKLRFSWPLPFVTSLPVSLTERSRVP